MEEIIKKQLHIPKFENEDEEREFWATHSSVDYFDWDTAIVNPVFPNLKPTTRPISLRLPLYIIDGIKQKANAIGVPYQALMKQKLAELV